MQDIVNSFLNGQFEQMDRLIVLKGWAKFIEDLPDVLLCPQDMFNLLIKAEKMKIARGAK